METMEYYIKESSAVLKKNISNSKKLTDSLIEMFDKKDYEGINIIACGSSYNAAVCASYFMEKTLKIPVNVVTPFSWENYYSQRKNLFSFVITQSGASTNSLSALQKMKETGIPAIGITGNPENDIKDVAQYVINYGVGGEDNGYVTKGVVTLIEFLILFSIEAALKIKRITIQSYGDFMRQLVISSDENANVYKNAKEFYYRNYKELTSMDKAYICGFGPGYGVALEGALKIGETIKIPSVAYEAEEYIHGPNIQLTPNYSVFFVDCGDESANRLFDIYEATKQITDRTYLITANENIQGNRVMHVSADVIPEMRPIYMVVLFQYIAFRVTTDLNKWKEHPLFSEFEKRVHCKTEKYESFCKEQEKKEIAE